MTPMIARSNRQRRPDLDMAPLIDVVFLLLIFFMLASSFSTPTALDLALPVGGDVVTDTAAPLDIVVDGDGRIHVDDQVVTLPALAEVVADRAGPDSDRAVRLAMDRSLDVQLLVRILDELRTVGVVDLDIATVDRP